ncbi:hypothetical protein EDB86DRAFT_563175 [Lactarius hatsudake]|nr:hypothetical protein EDB86DRAFT_563175 [Lactarius hatsudake]
MEFREPGVYFALVSFAPTARIFRTISPPHAYSCSSVGFRLVLDTRSMAESSSADIKLATPLLFGPLFNWGLYGVLCVQIYLYSYNFPSDSRPLKFLVCFVLALETVQTALTGADVYYWFIAGFGDRERLRSSHYAPIDIAIMDAITSLIVQEYFCYRIWTLYRRSSWFCLIIAVTAVSQSVGAAWGGFRSLVVGKYAVSKAALYLWSLPSALADIMIAVAMILLLRRTDKGRFSNFVLIRVVRLTIETNTLTASVAIASFVLFVAFPDEIYYTFTAGIIGKLYSNTLMVILNNRIYFRDHAPQQHGDSARFTVSGRARATTPFASLSFAAADPHSTGDSFKLDTISQSVDLEKQIDDAVSTSSQPVCAFSHCSRSPVQRF